MPRIISSGEEGAELAGLDAAIFMGISHGGFTYRGRKDSTQNHGSNYNLTETNLTSFPYVVCANIKAADFTLIFIESQLNSRGELAARICEELGMPFCFVIHDLDPDPKPALGYIREAGASTLNVVGQHEACLSDVYRHTFYFLLEMMGHSGKG